MNWLKQNWFKVGVGVLVLVVLISIKGRGNNSSSTALIVDTTLATVSPTPSATPTPTPVPTVTSSPTDEVIDPSKYAFVMPVEVGTKWIYEGKRIVYDSEQDKTIETTGQKIIEITSIKKEGNNLRVFISTSYKNNPDDFDKFRKSFLLAESGFEFDEVDVSYLPLVKGQRLTADYPERTDGYYDYFVTAVSAKNVFGKQHKCYDISYYTLSDESVETFCEGVGYIKDSYKHNGTPDEWDYKLISIEHPTLNK